MAARASEALMGATVGISSAESVDISVEDATLNRITRGIYVGGSGNLVVQLVGDNESVTLNSLAAGIFHPIQAQKIIMTGTTATGIVAGY